MAGATISAKGVLTDFLTPTPPKIGGEPTKEGLMDIHRLISGNVASVASNLGGGQHGNIALKMTSEEYVCAATQLRRLPTEHGERPITSARN